MEQLIDWLIQMTERRGEAEDTSYIGPLTLSQVD